ncbi:MAG: tRNA-intron lyase [Thermoplasmata archaeon]|nr:tRNA-intron lyase [Thermoplasmata archaeon]
MHGLLREDYILIENKRDASKLLNRGFGKPLRNGRVKLDLVEGAFLLERSKLAISDRDGELDFQRLFDVSVDINPRFGHRYMVYRDLRKRGFKLECLSNGFDFTVSPRNGSREGFVYVRGEREEFSIESIRRLLRELKDNHEFWIGIVDEEADITYYTVSYVHPEGNIRSSEPVKGRGFLIRNHVFVFDKEVALKLLREEFFGKPFGKGLQLSLIEALYLKEKNILDIYYNSRSIDFKELVTIALNYQSDIERRYVVYKELKERGLSVKTGFKFGTHFRAYEKDPHHHHAEYLIDVVDRDYISTWSLVSRGIRLAHSVKKLYTFAVIDKDIEYISFKRLRP